MRVVPFYNKQIFEQVKNLPRLRDASWWVRLNLFFSFSYLVAWDYSRDNTTLIWGKTFDGITYISSATWSDWV